MAEERKTTAKGVQEACSHGPHLSEKVARGHWKDSGSLGRKQSWNGVESCEEAWAVCSTCTLSLVKTPQVHLMTQTGNLNLSLSLDVHMQQRRTSCTLSCFISHLSCTCTGAVSLRAVFTFQDFHSSLHTGHPNWILQSSSPDPAKAANAKPQ